MKEVGKSEHLGDVVETKSSSGCLINEKEAPCDVEVVVGIDDYSTKNLVSSNKEKKRSRVVLSDSESSDELRASSPRKSYKLGNESVFDKSGFIKNKPFATDKRVNSNNRLGVSKFDELNKERITKDVHDNGNMLMLPRQCGDQRESERNGGRMIVDKKRDLLLENKSIVEDDEVNLTPSVSKYNDIAFDEPVKGLHSRTAHNPVSVSHGGNVHAEAEDWKEHTTGFPYEKERILSHNISKQHKASKKRVLMQSSSISGLKCTGKQDGSKSKKERKLKLRKPTKLVSDKVADEGDTSLHFKAFNKRPNRTVEMVKADGIINTQMENVTSVKGKESKIKHANCTEKQLLREKIKDMLFGAGWTIDYRPRRNRDYLDSVYISPGGTAYWSITKAYEALKKHEKDGSEAGGDFTSLPNDLLSKLTRQTRKKIEREIEQNRRHDGKNRKSKSTRVKKSARHRASDQHKEKLGSYLRPSRKSLEITLKEASEDTSDCLSDISGKETCQKDGIEKRIVCTNPHIVQDRESRKTGRRTLLVRGSDEWSYSENDGVGPYSGKRTVLSWLIDSGTVTLGDKVKYMNLRKTRVMEEGWITRDGIHCACCSKILTILRFELHSGSKLGQPFQNIFIQSGQSLMQCQIDAWNNQEESERKWFHDVDIDSDPNDDTCGLCGDGGDLVCCDSCPSTFHMSCLDLQMLPQGDWHCPNCACKYCDKFVRYCMKASGRTKSPLFICHLCEKKYHKSCSPQMDNKPINSSDLNLRFCGQKCQELYINLQKLIWTKHELDSGFSWSLIQRSDPLLDVSSISFSQRAECNSKLAVALLLMDECFLPIVDRRSGINLIHNVVYNCGSNISRLNYSGFFTAILERGDELVCAASIRIHGYQLAEMPFIGTRHMYRRQGMCRRLLHAIESALSSLKVEKLVIPAIEEHMQTWTNAFGFSPLEESHKKEMRSFNMLVFPGTDMLQKPLMKKDTLEGQEGMEEEYNTLFDKKLELNGNCSTEKRSEPKISSSRKKSDAQTDANSKEDVVQDGIVATEGSLLGADFGSKLETIDLQYANGITDSCEPQIHGTSKDTVSVDAHSDSKASQNGDETGQGIIDSCEPQLDVRVKETVSIDAHSVSITPPNGNVTNKPSPQAPNIATKILFLGEEESASVHTS